MFEVLCVRHPSFFLFKDWIHIWIKSHSLLPQSLFGIFKITGFLACLAFPTCDEVSYALQANAVFELRVHLLAEKAGFNDFKQSFFIFVVWVFSTRVYHLHRFQQSLCISHSCCLVLHPVNFLAFKFIV